MARSQLIKPRTGTLAQWATAEASAAVLADGEMAWISDKKAWVVGDGTTKVASLPRSGGQRSLIPDAVVTATSGTLTVGHMTRLNLVAGTPASWVVPAASSVDAGDVVAAKKTDTNTVSTVSLTPTGADTINGVAAARVMTWPEVALTLASDGVSNWSVVSTDTPASALSGTYARPSVIAATPTGVAATDTANLQAAIDATPVGGLLQLSGSPLGLQYQINATLTATKHITIKGNSCTATFASATDGGAPQFPSAPYLAGTIIRVVANDIDALRLSGSGMSANLANFGILFDPALTSTGHGINCTPTQTRGSGLDFGLTDFVWENVHVWGHDGNHYGYVLVNFQYGELIHVRSWVGGGFYFEGNGSQENWGNLVALHPIAIQTKAGTAGGYIFSSAHTNPAGGSLDLMVFIRPQCGQMTAVMTAGTQAVWNEYLGAGVPYSMTVISADFENSNLTPFWPGPNTHFIGNQFLSGGNYGLTSLGDQALRQTKTQGAIGIAATAIGQMALKANTTGSGQVAVGGAALTACTTGNNNTAVGNIASSALTTGSGTTAVGASSLQHNNADNVTAVGNYALTANTTGTRNTAVGSHGMVTATTSSDNSALGDSALYSITTGVGGNTGIGSAALGNATTGQWNTAVGYKAGVTETGANTVTTASANTFVGYGAGPGSANASSWSTAIGTKSLAGGTAGNAYATALGAQTSALGAGSVAIGVDNAGTGASTSTTNVVALGTALHQVQLKNDTTGAGLAALGANSPAITNTAPYTWFKLMSSDGSTVYVPAWK